MSHPCLRCGACCTTYRVAFHWSEADPALGGSVPSELVVRWDAHRVAMRGTDRNSPRCTALEGTVGERVACGIYPNRPTPCREVAPSWEFGFASPQCDKARGRHGLAPLTPADWTGWLDVSAPVPLSTPPQCDIAALEATARVADALLVPTEDSPLTPIALDSGIGLIDAGATALSASTSVPDAIAARPAQSLPEEPNETERTAAHDPH